MEANNSPKFENNPNHLISVLRSIAELILAFFQNDGPFLIDNRTMQALTRYLANMLINGVEQGQEDQILQLWQERVGLLQELMLNQTTKSSVWLPDGHQVPYIGGVSYEDLPLLCPDPPRYPPPPDPDDPENNL